MLHPVYHMHVRRNWFLLAHCVIISTISSNYLYGDAFYQQIMADSSFRVRCSYKQMGFLRPTAHILKIISHLEVIGRTELGSGYIWHGRHYNICWKCMKSKKKLAWRVNEENMRTVNADSLLPKQDRNLAMTCKSTVSILTILTYKTQ